MLPGLLVLLSSAVVSSGMGVDWRRDYDAARAEAREKGRLLLVYFYSDRPLCKTMDEETFADAEVARAAAERFVSVRVDIDAKPELFEATIGGRGGLASCVVDAGGDVISALHGFAPAPAFVRFLRRAESGYAAVKSAREAVEKSPLDPTALHALGEAYRSADSLRRAD